MATIERTKNASRNIFFGVLLKLYQILVPFFMRTVMIYLMGVQYLGLNSLFVSVLQVLNLAELGVGSAMVYSMYKPIAEDDELTICALMKLYRTYYRFIGGFIAVVGLVLTPFVPKLIRGDVPNDINIYVLYLLNLGATVLSYWLFAYKNSILQAHQRTDIISKVALFTSTVQYVLQLLVLLFFRNYYLYTIVMLVSQAMANIITAIYANHIYPSFKPRGTLEKQRVRMINKRIIDLFTSRLGTVVISSSDTIIISAFLGLSVLAIYQNYYFIISSIIGFITVGFSSITAGIGNSLVVETKEKNFNDLKKFTFIICWIAGFCSCCFLNLLQPFMRLWVGESLTLKYSAVVCFVAYFYVLEVNQLLNTFKDAGGIWHEDKYRPLTTAIANVGMNLLMVNHIGIYGIILSTVLSMFFVGMPWLIHNLFTILFPANYLAEYLKKLVYYVGLSLVAMLLSGACCYFIDFSPLPTLLLRGMVCVVIPNLFFLVCYRKQEEFKASLQLLNVLTHRKLEKFIKVGD